MLHVPSTEGLGHGLEGDDLALTTDCIVCLVFRRNAGSMEALRMHLGLDAAAPGYQHQDGTGDQRERNEADEPEP